MFLESNIKFSCTILQILYIVIVSFWVTFTKQGKVRKWSYLVAGNRQPRKLKYERKYEKNNCRNTVGNLKGSWKSPAKGDPH